MGRQQLEYFKVNTFKEIQTLSYLGKKKSIRVSGQKTRN